MRRAARRFGLREATDCDDWTLFWTDCSVSLDRVKDLKRYQVFMFVHAHTRQQKTSFTPDFIKLINLIVFVNQQENSNYKIFLNVLIHEVMMNVDVEEEHLSETV